MKSAQDYRASLQDRLRQVQQGTIAESTRNSEHIRQGGCLPFKVTMHLATRWHPAAVQRMTLSKSTSSATRTPKG